MVKLGQIQEQSSAFKNPVKHGLTTYLWDGKEYPLLKSMNLTEIVKRIEGQQKLNSYLSILMCGKSGSGKSTLTQTIIHRLSCMTKSPYVIKWFSGKDIHSLDEIIDNSQKGLKYILIFDDVSFVMDFLPSKRKKELAEKLTHIRHDLKGQVITILNIHYQKALLPIMRDADFRIITSMSDQDAANWKNTLGWAHRYVIDRYQRQYASMMQNGYWYVNGVIKSGSSHESYSYHTNKPFRLVLCSPTAGLYPILVPKEGCPKCNPKHQDLPQKLTPEQFLKKCVNPRTDKQNTHALTAIRYWAFYTKGQIDTLPSGAQAATRKILKVSKQYGITDQDALYELIKSTIGHPKNLKKKPLVPS